MSWVFVQCLSTACRLRFPLESELAPNVACPRCGTRVEVAATVPAGLAATSPNPQSQRRFSALLDNIRSIHNVGSMFRTADGAALDHLYLCGITATPEHPKLVKAALGAQDTVQWSYHRNAVDLSADLISRGLRLWGLERIGVHDAQPPFPPELPAGGHTVLVVGNEKAGVDPAILSQCERIIGLPMLGIKGSLNAAVAFGIAVYALRFGGHGPLDTNSVSA